MFRWWCLRKEVNDILPTRSSVRDYRKDEGWEQGKSLIVLDIPLLFEMNYEEPVLTHYRGGCFCGNANCTHGKKEWIYSPEALEQIPITDAFRRKVKKATIVWSSKD